MAPLEVSPRHHFHFLPQFHLQWWLVLHLKRDRPPAHQLLPDLPESSLSCIFAVQELVIEVVADGVRQNVDTWDEQFADLWWLDENTSYFL